MIQEVASRIPSCLTLHSDHFVGIWNSRRNRDITLDAVRQYTRLVLYFVAKKTHHITIKADCPLAVLTIMSTYPRRSPRFQQQPQNTQSFSSSRPSISQSSSASSTSHPSPTSDNLSLSTQPQYLVPPSQFDAPLPSPSVNEIDPFARPGYQYTQYNSYNYNMGNESQSQNQGQGQNNISSQSVQNNQLQSQNQNAFTQHHNSFSQAQRPNYPPTGSNSIPPGLPPDFLAEAAKRAQMACLMRDLGDVEL